MNFIKSLKIKKCLKKIQPEVDEELIKMNLLRIEKGKKIYARGTCHAQWGITKKLMKEKFNIDWESPQDKHPDIFFD